MKKEQLIEKIRRAESAIVLAGSELGDVLKASPSLPRASKTIITKVVDDAFDRLKSAKESLADLEKLLLKHREPQKKGSR